MVPHAQHLPNGILGHPRGRSRGRPERWCTTRRRCSETSASLPLQRVYSWVLCEASVGGDRYLFLFDRNHRRHLSVVRYSLKHAVEDAEDEAADILFHHTFWQLVKPLYGKEGGGAVECERVKSHAPISLTRRSTEARKSTNAQPDAKTHISPDWRYSVSVDDSNKQKCRRHLPDRDHGVPVAILLFFGGQLFFGHPSLGGKPQQLMYSLGKGGCSELRDCGRLRAASVLWFILKTTTDRREAST